MATFDQRLTIVQWGGDFREASERLASGGAETYRGQRYTVDFVEGLTDRVQAVTTITGFTEEPYDVVLPSGVRAIGAGFSSHFDGARIVELIEQSGADRLILRTPVRPVLRWARRSGCRTLLLLADSFDDASFRGTVRNMLLRKQLKDPAFEVVANHGVRAARSLTALGVDAARIIAWDYPAFDSPHSRSVKASPKCPFMMVFVGMLTAEKGVDDLVEATALLKKWNKDVRLDLVGVGETERVANLIRDRDLTDVVALLGRVPNSEIIDMMELADAVVVPSRHAYSEGMPLTIYEAYCSRTPVVVSDHPMFLGNVLDGDSGLIFPAGNAEALATQIERLRTDPILYEKLSRGGLAAWERLQLPVRWGELIDRWLDDTVESRDWIAGHSLAKQR